MPCLHRRRLFTLDAMTIKADNMAPQDEEAAKHSSTSGRQDANRATIKGIGTMVDHLSLLPWSVGVILQGPRVATLFKSTGGQLREIQTGK